MIKKYITNDSIDIDKLKSIKYETAFFIEKLKKHNLYKYLKLNYILLRNIILKNLIQEIKSI